MFANLVKVLTWIDKKMDRAAFQDMTDRQYEQLCQILGGKMADSEKIFYEEDGNEILDAVTYLLNHRNTPRIDLTLNSNEDGSKKEASVYWAGTVLRIDIKGLR